MYCAVKIDFQDGGHLGFSNRTILAIFDPQVTLMLPPSFKSIDLLVQTDFQDGGNGGHLEFPIGINFSYF